MFVVVLHYLVPLTEIENLLPAHRAFLSHHYASGDFLLSGPLVPRNGGLILATSPSRAALEQLLRRDPFAEAGAAHYDIIEFVPRMTHPDLAAWQQEEA